eukprot:303387_1
MDINPSQPSHEEKSDVSDNENDYARLARMHMELQKQHSDLQKQKTKEYHQMFEDYFQQAQAMKEDAKGTIDFVESELHRWRGDREHTSKELDIQLRALRGKYTENEAELQRCYARIARQDEGIDSLKTQLVEQTRRTEHESALREVKLNDQRVGYEARIRELSAGFERKIEDLDARVGEKAERIDIQNSEFSGRVASAEQKNVQEKIALHTRIKGLLEEVEHWNGQALRMEGRVRAFEKKLATLGYSTQLSDAEKKAGEAEIAREGKSSCAAKSGASTSDISEMKKIHETFKILTNMEISPRHNVAGVMRCKCLWQGEDPKMLEFDVEFIPEDKIRFTPVRSNLGEYEGFDFSEAELELHEVPELMTEVMKAVFEKSAPRDVRMSIGS